MKCISCAAALTLLALGCAPAPETGPVSNNTTTPSLSVDLPDNAGAQTPGAGAANLTLVSLKIPDMT